jgi:mycofactocin system creatininase family protein
VTRSRWLADLTWPELAFAKEQGTVLAVPVGATEQHGPHLPLSTDTDIAVAVCVRAATQRDVVIAPPVPYGSSGEHAGFPGTLSIGQAATELLLVELGRSASDTFTRLLFVSAHGGNAEPVARAVERLRSEGRDVQLYSPRWGGEPHAGRAETSMQLALDAGRVRMDVAEPGDQRPLAVILPELRAGGVRVVSSNGILGDPTGAHAGEGEALLARLTAELVDQLDSWMATIAASTR